MSTDSSVPVVPGVTWAALHLDSQSKAEYLAVPESDHSAYPFDGFPEHGRFKNSRGVTLHFYVWYPPCSRQRPFRTSPSSPPAGEECSANASRNCCCVQVLQERRLATVNACPECVPVERNGFTSVVSEASPQEAEPLPSMRLKVLPNQSQFPSGAGDFSWRPSTQLSAGSVCQALLSASGDLCAECLDCRAASAVSSRGVVLLLHGYMSHSRYSWLRRSKLLLDKNDEEAQLETRNAQFPQECCPRCKGSPQYVGSFVAALNARGFIVFALDCEGHGLSEGWQGVRGALHSLDGLAENCLQLIWIARRRINFFKRRLEARRRNAGSSAPCYNGEEKKEESLESLLGDVEMPLFVVGSSMGGWVATRCVQKLRDVEALQRVLPFLQGLSLADLQRETGAPEGGKGDSASERSSLLLRAVSRFSRVSGLVLSSPMFDVTGARQGAFYPATAPLLKLLSVLAPHFVVSKPAEENRYPMEAAAQQRDPLYLRVGTRANVAFEVLSGSQRPTDFRETSRLTDESCGALLLLHNCLDEMCRISGSLRFFKRASGISDKSFWVINGVCTRAAEAQAKHPNLPPYLNSTLLADLQPFVDSSLSGLNVFHSFASEPDGFILLERICEWLDSRA